MGYATLADISDSYYKQMAPFSLQLAAQTSPGQQKFC